MIWEASWPAAESYLQHKPPGSIGTTKLALSYAALIGTPRIAIHARMVFLVPMTCPQRRSWFAAPLLCGYDSPKEAKISMCGLDKSFTPSAKAIGTGRGQAKSGKKSSKLFGPQVTAHVQWR